MILDLASRVEGLMPGPLAAVFSGTTRLDGALRFADDGAVRVDRFDLTSRTARLALNGGVDAARNADLTLQARALPTEGGVTKAGESTLESLMLDASLKGPLDAPALRGTLKAAGLLGRGQPPRPRQRRPDGGAPAPHPGGPVVPARRRGRGRRPPPRRSRLAPRGRPQGVVPPRRPPRPERRRRSRRGDDRGPDRAGPLYRPDRPRRGGGHAHGGTPRPRGVLAGGGRPLGGRVAAKALLSGDPGRAGVTADVEASTEKLSLGTPALDRTLGRDLRFSGRLTRLPDGYAVQAARLTGQALTATLDGRATEAKADMAGRIDLSDLATLDPELAGKAGLDARLTGSLEHPDLALTLAAPEARAMGRPVRDLAARASVTDATGALDGTLTLAGRVDGKPLTAISTSPDAAPTGCSTG